MKSLGLKGFSKRRRCITTKRRPGHRVMPDLVGRRFTADKPNHIYVGGITYLPCKGGNNMYLATVIDVYSRKLVGHALADDHLRVSLVIEACLMPEESAEALMGQFSILIMAVCTPHKHLGTTAPSLVCANLWARWELASITPWRNHLTQR